MNLPEVEIHAASALAEASALLARYAPNARILAGGTDLLVDLKTARARTGHLISISRIDELRQLTSDASALHLGALVTAAQLGRSPLVHDHFPALCEAALAMAGPEIRNMATVGGNLASGVPSADLPPILIALRASVLLVSGDRQREVPLESFFVGPRRTVLERAEILTGVKVPWPHARFGAAIARLSLRQANGCAVASAACGIELGTDGRILEARIALGAVAPVPTLVGAGAALVGRKAEDRTFGEAARAARAACKPISDIRASATYRREMVGVLTVRALADACRRAREVEP